MTDAEKLKFAKAIYGTVCSALDKDEWHYKKDEENLTVQCGARGEDLPIDFIIRVDADRQLAYLLSKMSFKIKEDKRLDAAIAISYINNKLVHGCFDYKIDTGEIFFRMTNSFMESLLSVEVFTYMIYASCKTIDEYNDKFLMLSKGMLSLEKILEAETKE